MKHSKINKDKVPVVIIDNSLDQYNNIVLFPEKLAKANEALKKLGLPKSGVK